MNLQELLKINDEQIDYYKDINGLNENLINWQKQEISRQKKLRIKWVVGSVVVSGTLLTLLLIK